MGALMTSGGKTISIIPPHHMATTATADDARNVLRLSVLPRARVGDDVEFYAYERGMTDDEIVAGWALKGMLASHMGTDRHYLAECLFNGLPFRWHERDMQVLFDFCRDVLVPRGIVAHNTEKEIVCRDADVAGSIDLIAWDTRRKVYHIIDFKRSDKLRSQMRGYGKMATFTHLDACKGAGYALQTSIYQRVLERDYGMAFGDRVLLSVHADAPFATSVPYLEKEVDFILNTRIELTRARRAVADRARRSGVHTHLRRWSTRFVSTMVASSWRTSPGFSKCRTRRRTTCAHASSMPLPPNLVPSTRSSQRRASPGVAKCPRVGFHPSPRSRQTPDAK